MRSLETVARGEALLDPGDDELAARLREAARRDRGDAFKMLTEQEVKIIGLVARGRTNREIAGELYLSEKTVRIRLLDPRQARARAPLAGGGVRRGARPAGRQLQRVAVSRTSSARPSGLADLRR